MKNNLRMSLMKLKHFHYENRLQSVSLSYIASHLTTIEEREKLSKIFVALDLNGDG
jgi:hypothetical protein